MRESVQQQSLTEALQWPPFMHPLNQAQLWFPFPLYAWQEYGLLRAARPMSRVILSSNNESGKTSGLIPIFGLSAMVAFPGCQVYSTSGSEDQVKEALFLRQLEPLHKEYLEPYGWEISTASMTLKAPNGSFWKGYRCKVGGKAEGRHGGWVKRKGKMVYEPLIYLVDEAKTVEDDIMKAIWRIDPDFLLAVSTPGAEQGWHYEGIDPENMTLLLDSVEAENPEQVQTQLTPQQRIAMIEDRLRKINEMESGTT